MPEYLNMPTAQIKTAKFNPHKRIEPSRLTGLLLSIRQHGILEPLVLAHDFTLADGHRRLACAKLLNMETVPCAHYKETPLEAPALWVVLNSDTLNLTPAQWLAAVEAGLSIDTPGFPDTLKRRILLLIELMGAEIIVKLVEENRSPHIVDVAERIARYCDRRGDKTFMRLTFIWLLGSGSAFAVRHAIDEEIDTELLIEAIEQDRELSRVWSVG